MYDVWRFRYRNRVQDLIVPCKRPIEFVTLLQAECLECDGYADLIFFVLSCIVSIISIGVKAMLFATKLRTRMAKRYLLRPMRARRASLGGVAISVNHADHEAVRALKARFEEHRMEQRRSSCWPLACGTPSFQACWLRGGRYYCYVLQALFEVCRTDRILGLRTSS